MSQAQPKTKASELFNKLNRLPFDARKNEFTLKLLAKEAKALVSVDPATSHMCMGIISFYENKPDDVKRHFNNAINAIKVVPGESLSYNNYAVTLGQMGFYKDSLLFADKAYKLDQADLNIIETALTANLLNGQYEAVRDILRKVSSLHFPKNEFVQSKINIFSYIIDNSVSPIDFIRLQDLAYSLAHSKNIFIMNPLLELFEDEDSVFLSYEILLDKPVEEIVDLSFDLASALAHNPSLNDISDKVNISFGPWCE